MDKSTKSTILWSVVAAALLIGVYAIVYMVAGPGARPDAGGSLSQPVTAQDIFKGSDDAKVVLVEYSDFQCPACAGYAPALKEAMSEFSNHVKLVYRHFPLSQHQHAKAAAYAAEAAGKQGKFWEMHDLIFRTQTQWENQTPENFKATIDQLVAALNLNPPQFFEDFESEEIRQKVEDDYQSGIDSGVNSTPTIFLNGEKMVRPATVEGLKSLLREEIEKANQQ